MSSDSSDSYEIEGEADVTLKNTLSTLDGSDWMDTVEETTEKVSKTIRRREECDSSAKANRFENWNQSKKKNRSNVLSKYYRTVQKTTTSINNTTKMTRTKKETSTKQYSVIPKELESTRLSESMADHLDVQWKMLNQDTDESAIDLQHPVPSTSGSSDYTTDIQSENPFQKNIVSSRSFITSHVSSINRISDIFVKPTQLVQQLSTQQEASGEYSQSIVDQNNNNNDGDFNRNQHIYKKISSDPEFLKMIILGLGVLFVLLLYHVIFNSKN